MRKKPKQNCIFALTRGYSFREFRNYKVLIQRNRRIRNFLRTSKAESNGWTSFRLVIFHEGNINFSQQLLISVLSFCPLKFINVSNDFKLHSNNIWKFTSEMPLSYSLMCQFQYYHVWKYLKEYSIVCRIDEDVWMENFPSLNRDFSFITGALYAESHSLTNYSFKQYLKRIGLVSFYNHRFPFTNFYVTKSSIWQDVKIQSLLFSFYSHPLSADHRWGDLPILGVTLNSLLNQGIEITCDSSVRYRHLSHHGIVREGNQKILGENQYEADYKAN